MRASSSHRKACVLEGRFDESAAVKIVESIAEPSSGWCCSLCWSSEQSTEINLLLASSSTWPLVLMLEGVNSSFSYKFSKGTILLKKIFKRNFQIGVLGSECLDRRSSRRAWIGVLLGVLGSEFRSACLDRRSSRRAWIGVQIGVLGSKCLDRRAWIAVLLAMLGSEFQIGAVLRAWIGAVLPAWIGVSESLEERGVLGSAPCSLLGSEFQRVWKREEFDG
ncbi:hypothetical protein SO802_024854 [Lithocarpus litseifolius]|uniref:Uncharacterized protein n=1 Tax=Lithocarpus litseifolius TaxID=425828 RepID=A0AAW2CAF2_9ROSI